MIDIDELRRVVDGDDGGAIAAAEIRDTFHAHAREIVAELEAARRPKEPEAVRVTVSAEAAMIAKALLELTAELARVRAVLEAMPDRRDLVESLVASALVLGPEARTPDELALATKRVSDAVWNTIHVGKEKGSR